MGRFNASPTEKLLVRDQARWLKEFKQKTFIQGGWLQIVLAAKGVLNGASFAST
jgi:hypothetical protein